MSDPALQGFPRPAGATRPGEETPQWVIAEATCNYQRGGDLMHRDQQYLVDTTLPAVKQALAAGWLRILPASLQPHVRVDPATMQPTLKRKKEPAMEWIVATDGNGNDFEALTTAPVPAEQGAQAGCFVFFDDRPNGFEVTGQVVFKTLKRLGDGKFGA